ncbi:phosphotransferase [Micromonospora sp. IBHARD004]|uniref:phosphotransferase n=1 Tax=Micromonospora sp. IBHARD004 TaxID=3457764 RepID=UPI004057F1A5
MDAESLILEHVKPALAHELPPGDLERVTIVRRGPSRRRSSLYFLGLAGDGQRCRWVVKQPKSDSQQNDLASPLSAEDQFQALHRLYTHFEERRNGVSVPRPVASVPEIAAYIMEYVPGPTVTALIRPGLLAHRDPLLQGVKGAAQVLRALHSLEPAVEDVVDSSKLYRGASSRGPEVLRAAGLPIRREWFEDALPQKGSTRGLKVVLHGDFAPENVVLAPSGLCCLEPDLAEKDWAERDVVRFLLMLFDAPFFVVGADLPLVQRLRREAATTFLTAYYGDRPLPVALRPLMLASVASRWSTRHTDIAQRTPRLARARQQLLRRHFSRVLAEVSAPGWPRLY